MRIEGIIRSLHRVLRLIGQAGLHGADAQVRHAAKRRRLMTIMQELVYQAGG